MATSIPVYLEVGAKKVFAVAVEWPGWARSGRGEEAALEALLAYRDRYAEVVRLAGARPPGTGAPTVVERVEGNATTDFGAPGVVADVDREPLTAARAHRLIALLRAAWQTLDDTAARSPAALRKGPRGGGRDRDKMLAHVLGAEAAYARTLGLRHREPDIADRAAIEAMRADILATLDRSSTGEPLKPKGWPPRYALRRMAWHALDHAWEMADRSEPA
ncbi:hypothetical protein [Rhizomonospora bruguierae]|uniref:hypothetical protein n=1 Tax=Rhizomonospora bruguierae TaxID=1581705 RepID=UPI001BCCBD25|nr:hypothetical protein [Micromonospora sp. NBRC 107566]